MKLRIRHTKLGKIRFTSHRDTARHWERAVRKAQVRLAYSAGFTPRPKLSFGLALPTGGESLAEYLDMELDPTEVPGDLAEFGARLGAELPVGYEIVRVAGIAVDVLDLLRAGRAVLGGVVQPGDTLRLRARPEDVAHILADGERRAAEREAAPRTTGERRTSDEATDPL